MYEQNVINQLNIYLNNGNLLGIITKDAFGKYLIESNDNNLTKDLQRWASDGFTDKIKNNEEITFHYISPNSDIWMGAVANRLNKYGFQTIIKNFNSGV